MTIASLVRATLVRTRPKIRLVPAAIPQGTDALPNQVALVVVGDYTAFNADTSFNYQSTGDVRVMHSQFQVGTPVAAAWALTVGPGVGTVVVTATNLSGQECVATLPVN